VRKRKKTWKAGMLTCEEKERRLGEREG